MGAPYAFYHAPRRGMHVAIAAFVDAIAQSSLPAAPAFEGASYDSWPAAIRAAVQGVDPARPAILVIDELPYLTERDPDVTADLQLAWDRVLEKTPLLLICIGSDVGMMESLLAERSPLHGRPTMELRISPLDPAVVADLTDAPDAASAFDRYLIVGGFPQLRRRGPRAPAGKRSCEKHSHTIRRHLPPRRVRSWPPSSRESCRYEMSSKRSDTARAPTTAFGRVAGSKETRSTRRSRYLSSRRA